MTDTMIAAPATQPSHQDVLDLPMGRLADRLASLVPPPVAAGLATPLPIPRRSAAVEAALAKSRKKAAKAARRAMHPRSRFLISRMVNSFVSACSFIPYALVGLGLRLLMARLFFFDGQTRIDGPRVPLNIRDIELSVILPLHPRLDTFNAFATKYAGVPMSPEVGAYLLSYAEFALPITVMPEANPRRRGEQRRTRRRRRRRAERLRSEGVTRYCAGRKECRLFAGRKTNYPRSVVPCAPDMQ